MTKTELIKSLNNIGVHPRNYTLDNEPYKDSSWVLERSYNHVNNTKYEMWNVFSFERGKRYDEIAFSSENEACSYIYEKLKRWQETIKKFNLKQ